MTTDPIYADNKVDIFWYHHESLVLAHYILRLWRAAPASDSSLHHNNALYFPRPVQDSPGATVSTTRRSEVAKITKQKD
jgi:hypothetical protein